MANGWVCIAKADQADTDDFAVRFGAADLVVVSRGSVGDYLTRPAGEIATRGKRVLLIEMGDDGPIPAAIATAIAQSTKENK